MKKYIFVLAFCCLTGSGLVAQETIQLDVSVSTDSLLMGHSLRVTFSVQGADANQLEIPQFDGFSLQSGPNYSNSLSIINGQTSRQSSISFYLLPEEVGRHFIDPAFLTLSDGTTLETSPVTVEVYPNPDGIRQAIPQPRDRRAFPGFQPSPGWEDFFRMPEQPTPPARPNSPTRKKRKTYKL